jgi:hypothetical protein
VRIGLDAHVVRLQRIGHGAAERAQGEERQQDRKWRSLWGGFWCWLPAQRPCSSGHDRTWRVISYDACWPPDAQPPSSVLPASGAPLHRRPTARRPPCELKSLALAVCVPPLRPTCCRSAHGRREEWLSGLTVHGRAAPRDHRSGCRRDAVFQVRKRRPPSASSSFPLASSVVTRPGGGNIRRMR